MYVNSNAGKKIFLKYNWADVVPCCCWLLRNEWMINWMMRNDCLAPEVEAFRRCGAVLMPHNSCLCIGTLPRYAELCAVSSLCPVYFTTLATLAPAICSAAHLHLHWTVSVRTCFWHQSASLPYHLHLHWTVSVRTCFWHQSASLPYHYTSLPQHHDIFCHRVTITTVLSCLSGQ